MCAWWRGAVRRRAAGVRVARASLQITVPFSTCGPTLAPAPQTIQAQKPQSPSSAVVRLVRCRFDAGKARPHCRALGARLRPLISSFARSSSIVVMTAEIRGVCKRRYETLVAVGLPASLLYTGGPRTTDRSRGSLGPFSLYRQPIIWRCSCEGCSCAAPARVCLRGLSLRSTARSR